MLENEVQKRDKTFVSNTYSRFPLTIDHGKGCLFYDETGREYLDFTSGIGVNIFGVNDEEWKNVVFSQLEKVQHTSNLYYTSPAGQLAKLLSDKTGCKKVFFANSGAEANECAIKVARKYNSDKYGEGKRFEILVLKNSFHGRTLTTLSATAQEEFHHHFSPFPEGFQEFLPTKESFLSSVSEKTGAVLLELIQGESGVNVLDKKLVTEIAEYCHHNDILLMIDEVQTGNGRTGKLYSYEHYNITPDVVTTAKGLGGGLPIGACLLFEKVENTLSFGDHGSTFGGNPVACAGAVNIISRLDESLFREVERKGLLIKKALSTLKNVEEVSGLGLMIGIRVKNKTAKEVAAECLKKGLLVLTAHEKVRLLPPLIVSDEEIQRGLIILGEVIDS